MKTKLLIILFALLSIAAYAQSSGKIEKSATTSIQGIIKDSTNGSPVEFATVILYKEGSTKSMGGNITDKKGHFVLEGVPNGKYHLKITSIGYNEKLTSPVEIKHQNQEVDLGEIMLSPSTLTLSQVTITGQKGAIEFTTDKMIVNVEKTLPPAGGSAIDVLKNTPSVTVDIDNNVSLRGNSNISIQIDGRPSGISDPKMLDQLPAAMIDKIEIITNPSARYDADGTAGIINIVLKKKQESNFNALAQLNAGTKDNYGSALSFNYRNGDVNYYASYDNRFMHRDGTGSIDRKTSINSLYNDINNNFHGQSHNVKAGIDWSFSKFDLISTSFLYSNGRRNGKNAVVSTNSDPTLNYTNRTNSGSNDIDLDYNLNYKRTFETKGKELTADFFYTHSNDKDSSIRTSSSLNVNPNENIYNNNHNKLISLKSDFVNPINDDTKLEAGYKGIFRKRTADYEQYDIDSVTYTMPINYNASNNFNYEENIHAAYGIFTSAFNAGMKFKYQLGLRVEGANTISDLTDPNDKPLTSFQKKYFSLFPTINISGVLSEGHEIRASYSRRINRPNMWQINPFVRKIDDFNVRKGNPDLNPEYIDSYELTHSLFMGRTSFVTTLFYRQTNDNINVSVNFDPSTNIITQSFSNYDKLKSYGLEFNAMFSLFKFWQLNGSFSYYGTKYEGRNVSSSDPSSVWNARFNSTIMLPLGIAYQFNGFYMAQQKLPQGKMYPMSFFDMGLRKTFLDGTLVLGLRVSDVFNTARFKVESSSNNYTILQNMKMNNRIISFSITYNLNNFKAKRDDRPVDDNSGNTDYGM